MTPFHDTGERYAFTLTADAWEQVAEILREDDRMSARFASHLIRDGIDGDAADALVTIRFDLGSAHRVAEVLRDEGEQGWPKATPASE